MDTGNISLAKILAIINADFFKWCNMQHAVYYNTVTEVIEINI